MSFGTWEASTIKDGLLNIGRGLKELAVAVKEAAPCKHSWTNTREHATGFFTQTCKLCNMERKVT